MFRNRNENIQCSNQIGGNHFPMSKKYSKMEMEMESKFWEDIAGTVEHVLVFLPVFTRAYSFYFENIFSRHKFK